MKRFNDFNIRYLKLICLVGLAIFIHIIKVPEVKAIGITLIQDTPESLDISFGIAPPSSYINNGASNGAPQLILNGQYWNIFASSEPSFSPWISYLYVQQDRSGSTNELNGVFNSSLPTSAFEVNARGLSSGDFPPGASYLSSAPAGSITPKGCSLSSPFTPPTPCFTYIGGYSAVTCLKGSPDCVFYTFTNEVSDPNSISNNLRLMADYQPLEASEDVPEPLTIVGSILALGLGRRFLSKSSIKRQPTKTN
jgi:hypothetical protein